MDTSRTRRHPSAGTVLAAIALVTSLCAVLFVLSQPVGASQSAKTAQVLEGMKVASHTGPYVAVKPGSESADTASCPKDRQGQQEDSAGGGWTYDEATKGPAAFSILSSEPLESYSWTVVVANPTSAAGTAKVAVIVECLVPSYVRVSVP